MSRKGNIQLNFVITAGPDQVAEGDRLFADHITWLEKTHHRDGEKALLIYDVSKADELSNPLDPTSEKTGNVHFVLAEVYQSEAGVADHFQQAQEGWSEFPNFVKWIGACKSTIIPSAPIFNSLW
jgi:hypothetical protein